MKKKRTSSHWSWPEPEAYKRCREKTMSLKEEEEFTLCLFGLAKWFADKVFNDLTTEDRKDLVSIAVYNHIISFREGMDSNGKGHLCRILTNEGIDLFRKQKQRRKEVSIEYLAQKSGFENEYDLLDQSIDYKRQQESITNNDDLLLLEDLLHNREKLEPYTWKNTFFLYVEWALTSNEGTEVGEFCAIAETKYGLNVSNSVIYKHVSAGLKQLEEWNIFGGDGKLLEHILKDSQKKVVKNDNKKK